MFSLNYGTEQERERPLALYGLYGPEPFRRFFGKIPDTWGEWMLGGYPAEVRELPHVCPSPLDLPSLNVSWSPAEHRPESITYRLEGENGAFVCTGDTGRNQLWISRREPTPSSSSAHSPMEGQSPAT